MNLCLLPTFMHFTSQTNLYSTCSKFEDKMPWSEKPKNIQTLITIYTTYTLQNIYKHTNITLWCVQVCWLTTQHECVFGFAIFVILHCIYPCRWCCFEYTVPLFDSIFFPTCFEFVIEMAGKHHHFYQISTQNTKPTTQLFVYSFFHAWIWFAAANYNQKNKLEFNGQTNEE